MTRPITHSPLLVALVAAAAAYPASAAAQVRSVADLLPTDDRVLAVGGERQGTLSAADHLSLEETYVEAWVLEAPAGTSVTVDLLSTDFDAMLYVVGPGMPGILSDDDGAGGCDARITFTVLEPGPVRVVASSLGALETGVYTLRVSEQPQPPAAYACGQTDPTELRLLATEGRVLRMGSTQTGSLDVFSPVVRDGLPAQAWLLEGRRGDALSIVMESDVFDAYLHLVGPGLDAAREDDDGAGNLNAQIDVVLPEDGTYTVVASSISEGATGPYTIRVGAPVDLEELPTAGRTVAPGETRTGELTLADPVVFGGRQGQAWALEGTAGQEVTIDLASEDFDAYLTLVGPGLVEPVENDDFGGSLDSRISLTLPENGTYLVIVGALSPGSEGSFTLTVAGR